MESGTSIVFLSGWRSFTLNGGAGLLILRKKFILTVC